MMGLFIYFLLYLILGKMERLGGFVHVVVLKLFL